MTATRKQGSHRNSQMAAMLPPPATGVPEWSWLPHRGQVNRSRAAMARRITATSSGVYAAGVGRCSSLSTAS